MLNVTVANIGELAVVGCEGRMVESKSAYKLREAVTSQTDAQIIVLELSKVRARTCSAVIAGLGWDNPSSLMSSLQHYRAWGAQSNHGQIRNSSDRMLSFLFADHSGVNRLPTALIAL
jgi:hypothetical protein